MLTSPAHTPVATTTVFERTASLKPAHLRHYTTRLLDRLVPLTFAAITISALALGWSAREEQHITPKDGLGYWLGIAGAVLMLMLLLYPLRKRFKSLRRLGSVKVWFRAHMLFGIIGPTLILFHANFSLGSLNATVATIVMLIVVASGVIGRYLHGRVHLGLYGRRAEAHDLLNDLSAIKAALSDDIGADQSFMSEVAALERFLPDPECGVLASAWAMIAVGSRTRRANRRLLRRAKEVLSADARASRWTWREKRARLAAVREHLQLWRSAVVKTSTFAVYARALSLWHLLHLPLFLLLIITAVLHVVAVHLY
ncbi:MAG: pyridine nucleotide-disulfide oxidoreductase [Hyphomicrobium sp.]|jgi:hypothetical protein